MNIYLKQMNIPHFDKLKCFSFGVEQMRTKGGEGEGGGSQKMIKDERGEGGSGIP